MEVHNLIIGHLATSLCACHACLVSFHHLVLDPPPGPPVTTVLPSVSTTLFVAFGFTSHARLECGSRPFPSYVTQHDTLKVQHSYNNACPSLMKLGGVGFWGLQCDQP